MVKKLEVVFIMDEELKNKVLKTGTTTVGIICKDGIVLAADKRGVYGSDAGVTYFASSDETKILPVNDRMVVTIAGVVSDVERIIKLIRAELKLKELRSKKAPSIKEAANLFSAIVYQNIRQFSPILGITHFLLAGYDYSGFCLYDVRPDGHLEQVRKFSATGSGMMQCHPILDAEYRENLTLQEGMKLALKCVNAAMKRDPGTGEGIDIYVVTKDGIRHEIEQEVKHEFVSKERARQ